MSRTNRQGKHNIDTIFLIEKNKFSFYPTLINYFVITHYHTSTYIDYFTALLPSNIRQYIAIFTSDK